MAASAAEACASGEWSQAIKHFTSALAEHSGPEAQILCNRALCYSKLDLHRKALKDAEAALSSDPDFVLAYLRKGAALQALSKPDEACAVWDAGYKKAIETSADMELTLRLRSLSVNPAAEISSGTAAKNGKVDPKAAPVSGSKPASVAPASDNPSSVQKEVTGSGSTVPPTSSKASGSAVIHTNGSSSSLTVSATPKASANARRDQGMTVPFARADLLLSLGIQQVNAGQLEAAVATFDKILENDSKSVGAFIGRGTALALQHKLEAAVKDFTDAISISPGVAEAWKRRAQARAALGNPKEAVEDFNKALEIDPSCSRDVLLERGTLFVKLKDFRSALQDLRATISIEPSNKMAHNFMGLALVGSGECVEAVRAYKKALSIDPKFQEAWLNMGQAHKELADAPKASECFQKAISLDTKHVQAYRIFALLKYGSGDHKGAGQIAEQGLEVSPKCIELHYIFASSQHAIGEYYAAVKYYDETLGLESKGEEHLLQFLAFYQREIALYTASKLNEPFQNFKLDLEMSPFFKESWCKKGPPQLLFPGYTPQPMLPAGSLIRRKKDSGSTPSAARQRLLDAADRMGRRTQYSCPGFLQNVRQHRMGGLAILEIMQTVASAWQLPIKDAQVVASSTSSSKKGKKKGRPSSGLPGLSSSSSGDGNSAGEGGSDSEGTAGSVVSKTRSSSPVPSSVGSLASTLKWRDVFNISVRWRQISEPCDPVCWVDKLTEKEFIAGFGSHTPILIGQTRVVRYYSNFQRAFHIMKQQILQTGGAFTADNIKIPLSEKEQRKGVESAKECKELHDLVGQDFWVVTPCYSSADPGKIMDGTRLTLVKSPTGFDFAIRVPGTPQRWQDYDAEMAAAWEELREAVKLHESSACTSSGKEVEDLRERVQNLVLRMGFYWYNFMPLARGTAMVGYATMIGLLLAANMEVTQTVPRGTQVDWEAILCPRVEQFANTIRPWMCKSCRTDSPHRSIPKVSEVLPTIGSVVSALSSSGDSAV